VDTSLLEVMYSAKEECVFIRDLTDDTFQMNFIAWWTSMNVERKCNIIWKSSGYSLAWWFFKHCPNEKNGIPGIICIAFYVVLAHPSEYGTSSMGKHLATKMYKAELNKLKKSDVTLSTGAAADE
jgi:hypothetical protein